MSLLKELLTEAYKPYKGGAGPDEKQSKENDQALAKKLKSMGIDVKRVRLDKIIPEVADTPDAKLKAVVVGKRYLAYDRWGFTGGTINGAGSEDQIDFDEAIKFLKGKK